MDSLFQSPPIIENIFKHLSARDLCICAQVCKLWKSMSVVEFKQRRKICHFFQNAENDHILEHDGVECAFGEELTNQLNSLRVKSSFCIAFASESLTKDYEHLFPNFYPGGPPFSKKRRTDAWTPWLQARGRSVVKQILTSPLPPWTKTVLAVAPGIVGCCRDNTSIEVENGYTITGFCFPEIPGLEIHSYDYLRCNLEEILSKEQKAKCLLVFDSGYSGSQSKLNRIIDKQMKRNPNIAIGGATLNSSSRAVVIGGDKVEAASLIIKKQDDKKELKNKLKLFENTGLLKNQCFAFMFACVARGYDFHKEQNFESSTFHSLYPKVPLIGVFGDGEIGIDFLPSDGTTPSKKFPDRRKYFYSYSTVFVLVSIKD